MIALYYLYRFINLKIQLKLALHWNASRFLLCRAQ